MGEETPEMDFVYLLFPDPAEGWGKPTTADKEMLHGARTSWIFKDDSFGAGFQARKGRGVVMEKAEKVRLLKS
jgi:hypothetical protein